MTEYYDYDAIEVTEPFDSLLGRMGVAPAERKEPFSEFVARYPSVTDRARLLFHAVVKGSPELLRWVMANNDPATHAELLNARHYLVIPGVEDDGYACEVSGTVLAQAVFLGNLEMVRILVDEFRADINKPVAYDGYPTTAAGEALVILTTYRVTSPEDPRYQIAELLLSKPNVSFMESDVHNANLHAVLSDPAYARLQALVPPPFLAECKRHNEKAKLESLIPDATPA